MKDIVIYIAFAIELLFIGYLFYCAYENHRTPMYKPKKDRKEKKVKEMKKVFEGEVVSSGYEKYIYVESEMACYNLPFEAKDGDKVRITYELIQDGKD